MFAVLTGIALSIFPQLGIAEEEATSSGAEGGASELKAERSGNAAAAAIGGVSAGTIAQWSP